MLIIKLKMRKGNIGKHERIAMWTMKTKASYIFIMVVVIRPTMQTSANILWQGFGQSKNSKAADKFFKNVGNFVSKC